MQTFPSDLEIARQARLKPLPEIAGGMGIGEHLLEPYGGSAAKAKLDAIEELEDRPPFIYPLCGEMRTMPGLSATPAATRIDIDENGEVVGLS